jgi:hypothetical protein
VAFIDTKQRLRRATALIWARRSKKQTICDRIFWLYRNPSADVLISKIVLVKIPERGRSQQKVGCIGNGPYPAPAVSQSEGILKPSLPKGLCSQRCKRLVMKIRIKGQLMVDLAVVKAHPVHLEFASDV